MVTWGFFAFLEVGRALGTVLKHTSCYNGYTGGFWTLKSAIEDRHEAFEWCNSQFLLVQYRISQPLKTIYDISDFFSSHMTLVRQGTV